MCDKTRRHVKGKQRTVNTNTARTVDIHVICNCMHI